MRKVMIAFAVVCLTTGTLFAAGKSDKDDVLAVMKQCNELFNKGDTKAVIALGTDEMSIIDSFPPYEWHGSGAFAKWFADYDAHCKQTGITDGTVHLGKPRHVDIDGDRAYAVFDATYTWKQNGKSDKEVSSWTFTFVKTKDSWRITGWCWAIR